MMRNDYRRALILLRGNAPGYSGHVRLERRTLMGSMYFLTQTPSGCPLLRAALVGRSRDAYYACALGELRRDGRGQAVLSYAFDPRNLCGRELEQYQLIAITCAQGSECSILLYGYVNGHTEMNWAGVRRALCGLYADPIARDAQTAPPVAGLSAPDAQETPSPQTISPEIESETPKAEAPEAELLQAEAPGSVAETLRTEHPETGTKALGQESAGAEAEASPQECPEAEAPPKEPDREHAEALQRETERESPADAQTGAYDDLHAAAEALEQLGLDVHLPWPEAAEPLRELFGTLPAMENPPDGEYVYIEAPMPPDSGYACCAAGIRVEDGAPAAVRYALPAVWTSEPPAGLEDYRWAGDQNRGWWVTEVAVD